MNISYTYTANIISDFSMIDNIQSIFYCVVFPLCVLKGFFVAQLEKKIICIYLSGIILVKNPIFEE